jgi:anti-sigma B factor antagonist
MSKTEKLKISVRSAGDTTIVDLEGKIDISNSRQLRSQLFEELKATPRLALNMTAVGYVDSSGVATLVEALKRALELNKKFLMFGLTGPVHAVLKMTSLLGIFRIFDNEENALQDR